VQVIFVELSREAAQSVLDYLTPLVVNMDPTYDLFPKLVSSFVLQSYIRLHASGTLVIWHWSGDYMLTGYLNIVCWICFWLAEY
jgi:hypothetical protein